MNSKIILFLGILCSVGLSSCVDDFFRPVPGTQAISFGVDMSESRSRGEQDAGPATVDFAISSMERSGDGDSIFLHEETTDWPVVEAPAAKKSRSTVYNTAEQIDEMNVSAYYFDADNWSADFVNDQAPNFINDARAARTGSGAMGFVNPVFWPQGGKLRFLAYAPASYGVFEADGNDAPGVRVTIPDKVEDQRDFIVAHSAVMNSVTQRGTPVPMNFRHALTGIRFRVEAGMVNCFIKKIEIVNIARSATYRYDGLKGSSSSGTAEFPGTWYKHTWPPRESFAHEMNTLVVNPSEPVDIIAGENTFFMIPQHLRDTELRVTIHQRNDAGEEVGTDEVIWTSLDGRDWLPGKIVTYTLSYNSWSHGLHVGQPKPFPPLAEKAEDHCVGSKPIDVESFYMSYEDHQRRPAKWYGEFSADGNTWSTVKPDWFEFSVDSLHTQHLDVTQEQPGSVSPKRMWVHVLQQSDDNVEYIDLNAIMHSKPERGTEAHPWNLAAADGRYTNDTTCIDNTANCYIVTQAGWYIIPMVYGNAIKNGRWNIPAFHPKIAGTHVLSQFVNHAGAPIHSPWIGSHANISAAQADFYWQDVPFLIAYKHGENEKAISYDPTAYGGKGGIKFYIPRDYYFWNNPTYNVPVQQGNAHFGLKGPDGTLWSWHIWVTNILDPTANPEAEITLTNHYGAEHISAMAYLGWVSYKPLKRFKERKYYLRVTSTDNKGNIRRKIIEIKQSHACQHWHGHCNYYQWGRKDPFGGAEFDGTNRRRYALNGYYDVSNPVGHWMGQGASAIAQTIANPKDWHTVTEEFDAQGGAYGRDESFFNLWDATCSKDWAVESEFRTQPFERLTVKTIYDPCPVGYKVPPMTTYSGFVNDGIFSLNTNAWNGVYRSYTFSCEESTDPNDAQSCGLGANHQNYHTGVFMMYGSPDRSHFICLPLMGYRDWRLMSDWRAGPPIQHGTDVYLWTSGSHDSNRAYYTCVGVPRRDGVGARHVNVFNYYLHLDGCAVLPIKERN